MFTDASHNKAMTPPFTCPTRHPRIPIGSLQNLQGCHLLPPAHHLQVCTSLRFLQRYLEPYLLVHPPVSRNLCSPLCVHCGSATEHCKAATRDCTQISYKFEHQSLRNSHTCSANFKPDHAPCTILPTHKTPLIPMNS